MKAKEIFARASGGVAGAAAALIVPHFGCLGTITALFMGAGATAEAARISVPIAGGAIALAGLGAAAYGMQRSRALCCIFWGETRSMRLGKAVALGIGGFVAAAAVNTVAQRGLNDPAMTPEAFQTAQALGMSSWEYLNKFCRTVQP